MNEQQIREEVRDYYRRAAQEGSDGLGHDGVWGASRYDPDALADAPPGAAELSMGCGNPLTMVVLGPGDDVLDLGSGGGLDVILSAKRVAPSGTAYGVDELDEMIKVAQAHAAEAGVTNARFLKGLIERVPLPDASVDVVISNCVICLAPDKTPVFTEIARVLRPGSEPPDQAMARLPASCWSHPSAIWLRPALWVHRNKTVGRPSLALPSTLARAFRRWRAKRSAINGRKWLNLARSANWS